MPLQRTYYEILGVLPTATPDEIKKKYRELARKYHPDLVPDKALGQKVFAQINIAYRNVGDPERRRQYDSTLDPKQPGPSATSRPGATMGPGSSRATGTAPGASTGQRAPNTPPNPEDIEGLLADADSSLLRAQAQRALTICQVILKMDPRNARAYGTTGDAHMQLRQYEDAETAYRKSLEIAPSSLIRNKLSQVRMLMATVGAATSDDAVSTEKPKPVKQEEPQKRGLFGRLLIPKK